VSSASRCGEASTRKASANRSRPVKTAPRARPTQSREQAAGRGLSRCEARAPAGERLARQNAESEQRGRCAWESHLARAKWLTEHGYQDLGPVQRPPFADDPVRERNPALRPFADPRKLGLTVPERQRPQINTSAISRRRPRRSGGGVQMAVR
jgi:hypothetical protein